MNTSDTSKSQRGGDNDRKTNPRYVNRSGTQYSRDTDKSNQLINVDVKGGNPIELNDDTQLNQLKNKAAAVNPTNFICGVMTENRDTLNQVVRCLRMVRDNFLGISSLGIFIGNLIDFMKNINVQKWDMMIQSSPDFYKTLKKVGKDLSSVANSKKDKLAIFNAKFFEDTSTPNFGPSPDDC